MNNDIRRKVWPVLLNTTTVPPPPPIPKAEPAPDPKSLPPPTEEDKTIDGVPKLAPAVSFTQKDKLIQTKTLVCREAKHKRSGSLKQTPSLKPHDFSKRRSSYKSYDDKLKPEAAEDQASLAIKTKKAAEGNSESEKENEEDDMFITCEEEELGSSGKKQHPTSDSGAPALAVVSESSSNEKSHESKESGTESDESAFPYLTPATSQIASSTNVVATPPIDGAPAAPLPAKFLTEKDEQQVLKDVDRSLHNFDFFNALNEENAAAYKTQLKEMLIELLEKNRFHYYQGYNDFCSVFLLILGKKQGTKAAEVASKYLIKDFLLDSFEKGVRPMLFMLNDLLQIAVPDLYVHFVKLGVYFLLWLR